MEIATSWRMQGSRYWGPRRPIGVEIDNVAETMKITDKLKNKPEVFKNHGRVKEWAGVLVRTAHEWQYNEKAMREIVAGAAAQLNDKGEEFIEAAEEVIESIYKK